MKWFLIGFLSWLSFAGLLIILYIFLDYDWANTILNISNLLMNVLAIIFCIYTWNHYIKTSKKQEEGYNKDMDFFKSLQESYPTNSFESIKPIPFKRNRRNMSLLYMLAISVNLIAITFNIFF